MYRASNSLILAAQPAPLLPEVTASHGTSTVAVGAIIAWAGSHWDFHPDLDHFAWNGLGGNTDHKWEKGRIIIVES